MKNRTAREELKLKHKHIKSVCNPNNIRYEGVSIKENWLSFDGFYKDNINRFYNAKRKWENYQLVTNSSPEGKYNLTKVHLIRKNKALGFSKENTVFTSPSDRMKYHKGAHKFNLNNGALLGTRDIQNILKKKGISRDIGNIGVNKNKGVDITKPNRLKNFKWKGEFMSLDEISKKEGVKKTQLGNRVFKNKEKIKDAINYCKLNPKKRYDFKGEVLTPKEIIRIISKESGIAEGTITRRFYSWEKKDWDKFYLKKSKNKYAPYPKVVIAEKEGKKQEFKSMREAGRVLGLSASNISTYINKDVTWKLKGFHFYKK